MVPVWFQSLRFQKEFGSRMALSFAAGVMAFLLAWWNRDLLTDWAALLQTEGRLDNGAARMLAGELPYRDFYFSDLPGSILLHSLAQRIGFSARYFHLAAAALCTALVFHWSVGWGWISRALLFLLLLSWGIGLWNTAHPAWLSVGAILVSIAALRSRQWALAGLSLGLALWFHQQMGIAAFLGASLYTFVRREGWMLLAAWAASVFIPLGAVFLIEPDLGFAALKQIEWLPALPLKELPKQGIGAPLVVMGLWVLSLYFFRATHKLRGFSILAVLAYSCVGWIREGRGFLLGCLFLFSLLIWITAPLFSVRETKEERNGLLLIWLPAALLFLNFSGEFPPFLWLFPLTAYFLVWSLLRLSLAYNWLPRWWFLAPAILLLVGGIVHQSRLSFLHAYASRDPIGRMSYGEVSQVGRELEETHQLLQSLGVKKGDRILVLPAAPFFYSHFGYRNATPFDLVSEDALSRFSYPPLLQSYVETGAKFIVIALEPPAFLSAEIREKFQLVQNLGRFSVWRRNEN